MLDVLQNTPKARRLPGVLIKMRLKATIKIYLTLSLSAISLPALGFNPSSIPRHQQNAPERLEIEVNQVKEKKVRRGEIDYVAMEVQGRVKKVVKSATGLKEGETIKVSWLIPPSNAAIAGGWPAKIRKGLYHAYLRADGKDGKLYIPAAYTGSFVADKKP